MHNLKFLCKKRSLKVYKSQASLKFKIKSLNFFEKSVDKNRQRWYYKKVPIRKNKYFIKLVIKKQAITYNKIQTKITNFFVQKNTKKNILKNFKKGIDKLNLSQYNKKCHLRAGEHNYKSTLKSKQ